MLEIKNLNLNINKKEILKDINIVFQDNKVTAVIGSNASGKSSLIKCINNVYKYDGEILYNNYNVLNMNIKERGKKISILPQILKYPHILVYNLLLMGRNPYLSFNEKISEEDIKKVEEVLIKFNIFNLKDKYLDELSGGQRQIVYLAMQVIQDAELMIFDEPSSFLDVKYEKELINTIIELKEKYNKTIVIVMHDINKIIRFADNIVIVNDGRIIFNNSVENCLECKIIEKTFGLNRYNMKDFIMFSEN